MKEVRTEGVAMGAVHVPFHDLLRRGVVAFHLASFQSQNTHKMASSPRGLEGNKEGAAGHPLEVLVHFLGDRNLDAEDSLELHDLDEEDMIEVEADMVAADEGHMEVVADA